MKTVYSAGYINGHTQDWKVVGRGKNWDEARRDLSQTLFLLFPDAEVRKEFKETHRYEESHYEEQEE